jgi:hypothetical protein
LVITARLLAACAQDTTTNTDVSTEQFGQAGGGYTAQCSGWYPDWISTTPPTARETNFQMSQGYFLGDPVFTPSNEPVITGYQRPADASGDAAPWLAYDFHVSGQQMRYLNALLQYVLQDIADSGFVI